MYNPDYNLGEVVLEEPNTMESMQTHLKIL